MTHEGIMWLYRIEWRLARAYGRASGFGIESSDEWDLRALREAWKLIHTLRVKGLVEQL